MSLCHRMLDVSDSQQPLSVVFNAKGKPRLVVDLRCINQFLPDRKFRYEGLNQDIII